MKAKLNQTTTVAHYRPAIHKREKCGEKYMRYKNPQLVAQHVSMMKKRATKTKFVAQSRPALYFRNNYLQPATEVQRTLLLRDKLITQGEKRETSTQN